MKNLGTYGLLTPQVYGFSKKQSVDPLIPPKTVVIFDQALYDDLYNYCFQDSECPALDYLLNGLSLFFMRHPALWQTQFEELRVWNRDDFANHLASNHKIILHEYIDADRNKDIILLDVHSVVLKSHADVDKRVS